MSMMFPAPSGWLGDILCVQEPRQQVEATEMLGTNQMAEVLLGFSMFALATAELGIKMEVVTSDQLMILWCLIGGLLGAFCSLDFFPVGNGKWEKGAQLGVNVVLSATCSPSLVDLVAYWTGLPSGLRLALPISVGVGIVGRAAVFMLIPYGREFLKKRASDVTGVKDPDAPKT